MCGICGFVGRADRALIESMTASLAHRGPDGEGIELFPAGDGSVPAALGHRRLSILDTSPRGAQPMVHADRYWITYNGELYNFRELRSELRADGFRFRSDCDTEVLLAMYARYGEGMLDRLNGIFAFAIWDTERDELFLARDRLGVKPLYHAQQDGVLYFALGAEGAAPGPSPALAAAYGDRRLPDLPLGSRSGNPVRGYPPASGGALRAVRERRAGGEAVLGRKLRASRPASRRRPGPSRYARRRKPPFAGRWSPTFRSAASSAEAWIRAPWWPR